MQKRDATILALACMSLASPLAADELLGIVGAVDLTERRLTLEGEPSLPVGRTVQLEELRPGIQVRAVLDATREWPRTIVSVELVGTPEPAPDVGNQPFRLVPRAKLDADAGGVLMAQAPLHDAQVPPIKGLVEPDPAPGNDFIAAKADGEILVSSLLGLAVRNKEDERLGWVRDVLVKHDGRLSGIVISFGGFLGLGDRRVAVPMSKVELDARSKIVVVDMARSELDLAPEFREVAEIPH